jgi:hypothetical protein
MTLDENNNENENPWIDCKQELPSVDGVYEISNDLPGKKKTTLWLALPPMNAYYDGHGFLINGIYERPSYWRQALEKSLEKKYGKIK